MDTDVLRSMAMNPHTWIAVPVISLGSVGLGIALGLQEMPVFTNPGVWGCIIASFFLGILAYFKPKKDIVALIVPVFALIVFNPFNEISKGLMMQVLFAVTISLVAFRLERSFSEGERREE
jgi:hypothetical protein